MTSATILEPPTKRDRDREEYDEYLSEGGEGYSCYEEWRDSE